MNSRTVSHTATQAGLIMFFFFFFCQIFTRVSMFSGVTLKITIRRTFGKKMTCINKHVIG